MSEVGLYITDHRARLVLPGMDEEYSLIVLMDRYNLREFLTLFPQAEAKARLMRAFAGTERNRTSKTLTEAPSKPTASAAKPSPKP